MTQAEEDRLLIDRILVATGGVLPRRYEIRASGRCVTLITTDSKWRAYLRLLWMLFRS
jgi:ribosomal protein L22